MPRLRKIALTVAILFALVASYRILGVYEFRSGDCTAVAPRKFASTWPR